ncbi:MAG: hypothetical protein FWE57_04380 [Chitinispirillia bacterium]|nr:hypothetical protein [Chitinispirillia bacterium]
MKYLLEEIKAGTRNFIEAVFPKTETKIRIRLLNAQDINDASMAADKVFTAVDVEVSMQNIKVYEAEKVTQQLYRACSDLEGNSLASDISAFRENLTIADKDWLMEQYEELDEKCNPTIDRMSESDFDTLVAAVKKNPNINLSDLSIPTLRRLVISLASLPVSLQAGNGSISQ